MAGFLLRLLEPIETRHLSPHPRDCAEGPAICATTTLYPILVSGS